ncbi:hypothetical protein [Micromonospora deserti]|uniref:hypothetical protein n=1 Tax=Micromonospora deserti TaxID=2070366 RepID=UPI0013145A29|nr:hypothetical protein [Micromonospora deserti]
MLDNVGRVEQIRPLLRTVPGAVVLVTTRTRFVGLEVGPPESLPVMTTDEGLALLASTAGAHRVWAEGAAAAEVVRLCGQLPLAIRLAGAGWRTGAVGR